MSLKKVREKASDFSNGDFSQDEELVLLVKKFKKSHMTPNTETMGTSCSKCFFEIQW